jgi:hypothetical protein
MAQQHARLSPGIQNDTGQTHPPQEYSSYPHLTPEPAFHPSPYSQSHHFIHQSPHWKSYRDQALAEGSILQAKAQEQIQEPDHYNIGRFASGYDRSARPDVQMPGGGREAGTLQEGSMATLDQEGLEGFWKPGRPIRAVLTTPNDPSHVTSGHLDSYAQPDYGHFYHPHDPLHGEPLIYDGNYEYQNYHPTEQMEALIGHDNNHNFGIIDNVRTLEAHSVPQANTHFPPQAFSTPRIQPSANVHHPLSNQARLEGLAWTEGEYRTSTPLPQQHHSRQNLELEDVIRDDYGVDDGGDVGDDGAGNEIAEYGASRDEWKSLWSSRKAFH